MIKSIELSIATKDSFANASDLIKENMKIFTEDSKYISYLKFIDVFYNDDCTALKKTSIDVATYTGKDYILNEYVESCEN